MDPTLPRVYFIDSESTIIMFNLVTEQPSPTSAIGCLRKSTRGT